MSTPKLHVLYMTAAICFCLHQSASCQSPDYSSYEIAKKYKKDNNFVLAYKHLLIFKFSNIERFNKPENSNALNQVDTQIKQIEEYLSQNYAWYDIKKSRGFSDKQLDSTLKNQGRHIKFDDIAIQ
jgi:hypothetical protein